MKFWLDVDGALLRQAAALADPIRKALVASIDVEDVLDQWERTYPEGTAITRMEGRQWAKATVDVNEQPLIDVMGDVYATGFVMGDLVATASYGHESMKTKAGDKKPQPPSPELVEIAISVDWSKWKPGNKPAEALMSPKGALRKLLRSRKKLVNDVSLTTVNSIGNILARGLGAGTDRFTLATMIDEYLDNPSRSLMISTTELTRGMQTTALEQFKEFGNKVRWLALDPCEFCAGNAAEGTVSPGYEFKDVNGNTIYNPPAHPHCRCALTPVVDLNPDIPSLDLALQAAMLKYSDAQARDERGRWTSGIGGGGYVAGTDLTNKIKTKDLPARPRDEDGHDPQLEYVAKQQGFDGPAQTITEADLAKMDKPIVVYRGVMPYTNAAGQRIEGAAIEEDFISGQYFAGLGGAGNGTYWHTDKEYASGYGDGEGGHVIKAVLDPSIKIAPQGSTSFLFDAKTKAAPSTTLAMQGFDGLQGYKTQTLGDVFITYNRTAVRVVKN